MTDRYRNHLGRDVVYYPSDAEAGAVSAALGSAWSARVVAANADRTVNLIVFRSNGTTLAKTGVFEGETRGKYSVKGLGPTAP